MKSPKSTDRIRPPKRAGSSARAASEAALQKFQQFLDRTGRLAGVGGWEFDLARRALLWSDETCRIHGLAPGHQPTLDEALTHYPAEARAAVEAAVAAAIDKGTPYELELPLVRADGKPIWIRTIGSVEFESGRAVRLVGAIQDVTERVAERRALEEANARTSLATDSGQIGIWDLDLTNGAVVWDAMIHRLFQVPVPPQGVTYEHWRSIVHPDDLETAERELQEAIAGTRPFDTEFRIVWPDGSARHIRGAGRVQRDAQGQAVRIIGANWDITEHRELSNELAQQHELLRVTLQSIGDAVITTDAAAPSRITWLNPVAERMTGWPSAQACGLPTDDVLQIVHEGDRRRLDALAVQCMAQGRPVARAEPAVLIGRGGQEFGIEDSAAPMRSGRGDLLGTVLVLHDVTEQRRLTGEMNHRATHDALTGLVNRGEFEARLRRLVATAQTSGQQHALLFIDLDRFKIVNDSCGHAVGDRLLQQVAKMLGTAVRASDTLARLGGDEFAIILEQCPLEHAQKVGQQICQHMEDFRFVHEGQRFRIGTSIGLVPVDARWSSPAALQQAADTSCYAAKEAGRNRVHTWFDTDAQMQQRSGQTQWASRLETALDENRFVLHAQRIVPLGAHTGGLRAEVLLRMQEADGSLVQPGAFLPAAERFHLGSRIDRWVLAHAIGWMRGLADRAALDSLSVNLSGQSVGDRAFHRWALAELTEAGPAIAKRLCLEITETAAITHLSDAASFVDAVRAMGVRVALDDFGAGASSFGYLKTLHVDQIKIDGQFIRDLETDPLDEAAVRCFIEVARVVGLQTVAEFVDQPGVLQRVRELGVDAAQGFLLHRPEPLECLLASGASRSSADRISRHVDAAS